MKNCLEGRGRGIEITFRACDFYPCLLTLGKWIIIYSVSDQKERKIIFVLSIDINLELKSLEF